MAGVERFELPTVGFGDRCSTNWNYTPIYRFSFNDNSLTITTNTIFTFIEWILVFRELRDTREVRRYYTNQNILLKGYLRS